MQTEGKSGEQQRDLRITVRSQPSVLSGWPWRSIRESCRADHDKSMTHTTGLGIGSAARGDWAVIGGAESQERDSGLWAWQFSALVFSRISGQVMSALARLGLALATRGGRGLRVLRAVQISPFFPV